MLLRSILLVAIAGAVWSIAGSLHAHVAPHRRGAVGAVVRTVLALAVLVVAAQLLGSVGLFAPWPLAALLGAAAVVSHARSPARDEDRVRPRRTARRASPTLVTATSVALLACLAAWVVRSGQTAVAGVRSIDSLHYHLPHAVTFVRTGWVVRLDVIDPALPLHFHPATTELILAVGLMMTRGDLLTALANLAWLVFALVAAWAAVGGGNRGLAASAGVGAIAATPVVLGSHAGSAVNDMAVTACLLASAAVLLAPGQHRHGDALVAGLAAGLALGSKLSAVAPVALLTVAYLVGCRHRGRPRHAALWVGALGSTSALWYARNLVTGGSPVPSLDLTIGGVGLPGRAFAGVAGRDFALVDYLTSPDVLRTTILPALRFGLGPLWAVLLLTVVVGVGWTMRRDAGWPRWLGVVALGGLLAYVATPWTAFGDPGDPNLVLVRNNTRYAMPAMALATVVAARAATRRGAAILVLVATASTVSSLLVGGALPTLSQLARPATAWAAITSGLAISAATLAHADTFAPRRGWARRGVATTCLVAAVAAVAIAMPHHRTTAYTGMEGRGAPEVWAWARGVEGATIATAGWLYPYGLVGRDLENVIRPIMTPDRDPVDSCESAVRALHGADYAVLGPYEDFRMLDPLRPPPPPDRQIRSWLLGTGQVDVVVDTEDGTVLQLHENLTSERC